MERDESEEVEKAEDAEEGDAETPVAEVPVEASDEASEAGAVDAEVIELEVPEIVLSPEEKLAEQLAQNQARLRTVSKAYTDLQGEMAAFRERTEQLGKMKAERASFDAVAAFFDPVQNLNRSLEAGSEDLNALRTGVEMVVAQFNEAMRKLGLEAVPGVGAEFDPKMHEALAVTPVTDAAQDGKVLMVHQGGYVVNGKVLQAAQVVIGKHEEAAEA